ncbi:baseplate J/gp47 family protein [Paenibacillus pasadenensis]|uniref:baseplate J/gp47 family protein n=1 Tax=Paenibacillus pasadenensis TaxID=217090 RepID=UPI00203E6525|nr:baseplate J/gp47 family protein [Paenibacillus pasadenensis]MCM3748025.1 baseplate J/gp47 family protein [Paenibacillus pasadenensis]
MYEHQTYTAILERMLERVPNEVDKREGSIIFDALAPAAAELAGLYQELDIQYGLSFADTASGEFLTRRAAEHGVKRKPASAAVRLGKFYDSSSVPMEVLIGTRFSAAGIAYAVREREAAGEYRLEAEAVGTAGNAYSGLLLPLDYVPGLARAELADVIVPGEEEETDHELRERFFLAVNEQPFGGNLADYRAKIGGLPGVGGVKIYPAWNGGGTVKATIIGSDFEPPTSGLVEIVQMEIDPDGAGLGIGLAPIGHKVTIASAAPVVINVETNLTLQTGTTPAQLERDVRAAIEAYFMTLKRSWSSEEWLVVRISQLETRILGITGITDITGTTLNGTAANLELGAETLPVLGTVILHG